MVNRAIAIAVLQPHRPQRPPYVATGRGVETADGRRGPSAVHDAYAGRYAAVPPATPLRKPPPDMISPSKLRNVLSPQFISRDHLRHGAMGALGSAGKLLQSGAESATTAVTQGVTRAVTAASQSVRRAFGAGASMAGHRLEKALQHQLVHRLDQLAVIGVAHAKRQLIDRDMPRLLQHAISDTVDRLAPEVIKRVHVQADSLLLSPLRKKLHLSSPNAVVKGAIFDGRAGTGGRSRTGAGDNRPGSGTIAGIGDASHGKSQISSMPQKVNGSTLPHPPFSSTATDQLDGNTTADSEAGGVVAVTEHLGDVWRSARAFILYHLSPHDRSMWSCFRDPIYWSLTAVGLIPHPLLSNVWWLMLYAMKDRGDEYQLCDFIISFECAKVIAVGVIGTLRGSSLYFLCTSLPGSFPCDQYGPSMSGTDAVFFLLQVALVLAAYMQLMRLDTATIGADSVHRGGNVVPRSSLRGASAGERTEASSGIHRDLPAGEEVLSPEFVAGKKASISANAGSDRGAAGALEELRTDHRDAAAPSIASTSMTPALHSASTPHRDRSKHHGAARGACDVPTTATVTSSLPSSGTPAKSQTTANGSDLKQKNEHRTSNPATQLRMPRASDDSEVDEPGKSSAALPPSTPISTPPRTESRATSAGDVLAKGGGDIDDAARPLPDQAAASQPPPAARDTKSKLNAASAGAAALASGSESWLGRGASRFSSRGGALQQLFGYHLALVAAGVVLALLLALADRWMPRTYTHSLPCATAADVDTRTDALARGLVSDSPAASAELGASLAHVQHCDVISLRPSWLWPGLYWIRTLYGLLSAPFLVFKLPLVMRLYVCARQTGYDSEGRTQRYTTAVSIG